MPLKDYKAVREGHWRSIRWMASSDFTTLKNTYERVLGKGGVYFRSTDRGVVVIVLDEHAPGYVGFRTSQQDEGHLLRPGSAVPSELQVRTRYAAFQVWLPTVRRGSAEERVVISWIRRALQNQLALHELGDDWVFLNQEWRFVNDGGQGKKSDVLAVHLPTGRLGIVEAKDSSTKLQEACHQLKTYARFWNRDKNILAPYFSEQLHVQGLLYDSHTAAHGRVSLEPAALFFASPHAHSSGVCVTQIG